MRSPAPAARSGRPDRPRGDVAGCTRAVAHYTATELRATLSVRDGRLDVRLTAPGYAAGPAGDH